MLCVIIFLNLKSRLSVSLRIVCAYDRQTEMIFKITAEINVHCLQHSILYTLAYTMETFVRYITTPSIHFLSIIDALVTVFTVKLIFWAPYQAGASRNGRYFDTYIYCRISIPTALKVHVSVAYFSDNFLWICRILDIRQIINQLDTIPGTSPCWKVWTKIFCSILISKPTEKCSNWPYLSIVVDVRIIKNKRLVTQCSLILSFRK